MSDPSSRLMRFRLKLEEYEYEVVYKPGKLNSNADALSRIYTTVLDDEDTDNPEYTHYLHQIQNSIITNNDVHDVKESFDECSIEYNLIYFTDKNFSSKNEYHNSIPELECQNPQLKQLAYLKSDDRYYIYLIIKNSINEKPQQETLFYSLINLRILQKKSSY